MEICAGGRMCRLVVDAHRGSHHPRLQVSAFSLFFFYGIFRITTRYLFKRDIKHEDERVIADVVS